MSFFKTFSILATLVLARTVVASTFDLESFTPAELSGRYQERSCKISLPSECTLYLADRYDPSFMIIRSNSPGSWRAFSPQGLLSALFPDGLAPSAARVSALPKHASDDPETFAVMTNSGSGKLQIVEQEDWSLLTWMPDLPTTPGFETVTVTLVDTPPPQELREIDARGSADVVDEDSLGGIWYSVWENEIYFIDPTTDLPQPMTGGAATGTPDGLVVDSRDVVWFGGYYGHYMGALSAQDPLVRLDMPYPNSNPAIPCEDPNGNIWITDHLANRLTEFDPFALAWGRSIVMPVPSAWVTQCHKDPALRQYG